MNEAKILQAIEGLRQEVKSELVEVKEHLKAITHYAIQNSEKLDNQREHVNDKFSFHDHKSRELEERIFKIEQRVNS